MRNDPTMTLPLASGLCRDAARLGDRAADLLDSLATEAEPSTDGLAEVFRLLESGAVMREQAQRSIVAAMREQGLTWEQVGSLLGITRQAAWERFGKGSHGVG